MDSVRAIRWCSTMADAPRMDHKQLRRAKKLIRKLCCNYDHGNCLALDDGEPCVCVQGISYSLLCNWFRNAVLPTDHELLADVMRERPGKRCTVCGKPVYSSSNRAKYCPACAKQERRNRTPNGSVNNTGTSADRGHKSPVPQGFFHAESQGAASFYLQAQKRPLSAENCPCAGCVFFCAGALFFLKGDHHG